jgi:hypothetical protein
MSQPASNSQAASARSGLLLSTRPCPAGWCLPPSGRVRLLPHRAVTLGPGWCGGNRHHGNGSSPGGCPAVERLGRRPGRPGGRRRCRGRALVGEGRWRPGRVAAFERDRDLDHQPVAGFKGLCWKVGPSGWPRRAAPPPTSRPSAVAPSVGFTLLYLARPQGAGRDASRRPIGTRAVSARMGRVRRRDQARGADVHPNESES